MKLRHLLLLSLLCIFTLFSSSKPLSETELSAMLSLSKAVGAEKILNWTDAEPCNWPKVKCSSDGISVIQIGNQNLKGSLPSEIRNLTNLLHLEVQNNSLSGSLPSFNGLSNLQILLLHDNLFSSIPSDFFSGMSSLQTVSLDHNPFSPWKIPETLTESPSLGSFSATEVNLTGTLPDFFGNFAGLKHLALAYNSLSGPLPVSLSALSVQELWLNNQNGGGFSGGIDVIQNMTSLAQVWLHSNSFTGPIPNLSKLQYLYELNLRDNHLTGIVPNSLINLPSLKNIILANNFLQGTVPQFPKSVKTDLSDSAASNQFCLAEPGNCSELVNDLLAVVAPLGYPQKLASDWKGNDPCQAVWLGITCGQGSNVTVINFMKMGFSGTISPEFQRFKYLQKLLLSDNNLTGTIPVELADLTNLVEFDVRNNSLYGAVPPFNGRVTVYTDGNPDIGKIGSGGGSSQSPGASSPSRSPPSNHGGNATDANAGSSSGGKASVGIVVGSVIGGVVVVILLVVFLGYWFYKKNQHRFGRVQSPNTMVIHPRHSGSDSEMVKITVAGSGVNGGTHSENYSRTSSGPSDVQVVEAGNMVISIQVLRNVTNNFSEENILGRGGFGTVYKGELHDGTKIAVKRMESGVIGNKGLNEFKSEIAVLTKVRHRHLVALLGYCLDGNERLLVYEYMPQGTLSQHLFDWKEESLKPLEWMKRLSIALDVARGVEYLHSLAHQSFIHRDLKPSNILLGDDMKAKVADFGLVRLAPEGKGSVETRLAGTFGYLAPEYAVTGRVTTKVDVFSFGVILMELITGRRALDENQPEESVHLVTWFRRMHVNKETFQKAIDPTIELTEETLASVNTVAELAGHCCAREPYQRPDMGHAVNVLSTLVDVWKPTNADFEDSYGIDLDMTLPQALKKWQEDSSATSSFVASTDNTQTSIPTRPTGFAESFTSADGR